MKEEVGLGVQTSNVRAQAPEKEPPSRKRKPAEEVDGLFSPEKVPSSTTSSHFPKGTVIIYLLLFAFQTNIHLN